MAHPPPDRGLVAFLHRGEGRVKDQVLVAIPTEVLHHKIPISRSRRVIIQRANPSQFNLDAVAREAARFLDDHGNKLQNLPWWMRCLKMPMAHARGRVVSLQGLRLIRG